MPNLAFSCCLTRLFGLAGIGLWLAFPAVAGDWPQWRGPNRDGISTETGWVTAWPAEGPKRLWETKVGMGYSSMAVAKGRVYTIGNNQDVDRVSCLDAMKGTLVWKHEYPCRAKDPNGFPGPRSTPTVDGDRVYTLSRHGDFFCLDATSGAVKWSKQLVKDLGGREPTQPNGNEGWGYSGSALIEKEWVLIEAGGKGCSVIAFNKRTGEIAWKNGDDGSGYSSLAAFDYQGQRCLAQFSDNHIILRRMKDGSELARAPWKTSYSVNAATPLVAGDRVFVASGYGVGCGMFQITPAGLKELWRNKNMKNQLNTCVLLDGFLYGYDENDLKCMDWASGEVKWGDRSYGKGALMVADKKLILFSPTGRLGLAEATPTGFKELAGFKALDGQNAWANPVLANGVIYARAGETMAAFSVKP